MHQQINLPPTPEEFARVDHVLALLSQINKLTDSIMRLVAEHAYDGFPRPAAAQLSRLLTEAATLCRRCEHALAGCSPRAVMAADGAERRNLVADVQGAVSHCSQVASAARSVLKQLAPSQVAPASTSSSGQPQRGGERVLDAWSGLFNDLQPAGGSGGSGAGGGSADDDSTSPLKVSPSRRIATGNGTNGSAALNGTSVRSPPSAALSLWNARTAAGSNMPTPNQPVAASSAAGAAGDGRVDGFETLAAVAAASTRQPAACSANGDGTSHPPQQPQPMRTPALRTQLVPPRPVVPADSGNGSSSGSRPPPQQQQVGDAAGGSMEDDGSGVPSDVQQQQMMQLQLGARVVLPEGVEQQALNINDELIEHKKGALQAVAAEVHQLNELFVELGQFVALQGQSVQDAAMLAHDVYDDVTAAREEIEKAEREQDKCVIS